MLIHSVIPDVPTLIPPLLKRHTGSLFSVRFLWTSERIFVRHRRRLVEKMKQNCFESDSEKAAPCWTRPVSILDTSRYLISCHHLRTRRKRDRLTINDRNDWKENFDEPTMSSCVLCRRHPLLWVPLLHLMELWEPLGSEHAWNFKDVYNCFPTIRNW